VALVLRPLVVPARDASSRADYDASVYKDQLAEVDRDLERGTITEGEAEAARTEIARRLLTADREGRTAGGPGAAGRGQPGQVAKIAALVLTVAIPAGAMGVYLWEGAPGLPAQPFAERDQTERQELLQAELDAAALQQELEDQRPDDLAGWIELGQRWARLDRWAEAAQAYGRAVGLTEGEAPRVLSAYGEALVNVDEGTVTAQAIEAFERVLAVDPTDPRAQYFLGVAAAQAGDDAAALERFRALLSRSPADAPWVPVVRDRITAVASRLDLDVAEVMPETMPAAPEAAGGLGAAPGTASGASPGSDAPAGSGEARRGPSEEEMAAASDLPPEAQAEMIRGMVEGLAARLEQEPDDLDGWLQLGRSYAVLGRPQAAADAYARAHELAPDDPAILAAWADALLAAQDADEPAVLSDTFVEVMEKLYALDPTSLRALWFLGVKALQDGEPAEARGHWETLLAQLDEGSEEYALIEQRLQDLESE
jgi:cytochrome c-type biogenesis protein CcmH